MRRIIFVPVFVFLFFLMEFILFNMVGRWFMPNLLLLLIMYFNFSFGIRYSIFAAVLAGVFKDCFGAEVFGLNIFVFVLCVYLTTLLKKYLHYGLSHQSRILLVFVVTSVHYAIHLFSKVMGGGVHIGRSVQFVFIPEILTTLIVASFVFNQLRKCALKLFA